MQGGSKEEQEECRRSKVQESAAMPSCQVPVRDGEMAAQRTCTGGCGLFSCDEAEGRAAPGSPAAAEEEALVPRASPTAARSDSASVHGPGALKELHRRLHGRLGGELERWLRSRRSWGRASRSRICDSFLRVLRRTRERSAPSPAAVERSH